MALGGALTAPPVQSLLVLSGDAEQGMRVRKGAEGEPVQIEFSAEPPSAGGTFSVQRLVRSSAVQPQELADVVQPAVADVLSGLSSAILLLSTPECHTLVRGADRRM